MSILRKNIFAKATATLMCLATIGTVQANAETTEIELPQHDISVSMGALSSVQLLNFFTKVAVTGLTLGHASMDNEEFSGAISGQYLYRHKRWLSYGGSVTYEQLKQDCINGKEKIGEQKLSYIGVMPTVRFSWLNKRVVTMYSKVGFGMTFVSDKYTNTKEGETDVKVETENSHFAAFQVSPIGIQVGTRLYGMAEMGFGNQGMFLFGIGYKFHK